MYYTQGVFVLFFSAQNTQCYLTNLLYNLFICYLTNLHQCTLTINGVYEEWRQGVSQPSRIGLLPESQFQSLILSEILGYISVLKSKTDIRNMISDQHSYSKRLCERRPGMYQNSADADRFGRQLDCAESKPWPSNFHLKQRTLDTFKMTLTLYCNMPLKQLQCWRQNSSFYPLTFVQSRPKLIFNVNEPKHY